jgi:hypothetical protein
MNPELLAKIRQGIVSARKAGVPDAAIDALLQEKFGISLSDAENFSARDAGRAGAQGLTLGFSDELAGAGAAMVPGGDDYAGARDKVRGNLSASRAINPGKTIGTEVASGILPGVAAMFIPGAQAAGAGFGANALNAAKVGGLLGSVGGAGYSDAEDASGVAQDAAIGGGIGAVAGPVFEGAGAVAGGVGRRVRDAVSPNSAVMRNTAPLVPKTAGRDLARQETMAPGTGTISNLTPELQAATVPGVGANAKVAMQQAEKSAARLEKLQQAKEFIGAQYNSLTQKVPLTPALREIIRSRVKLPPGAQDVEASVIHAVRSDLKAEAKAMRNKRQAFMKRQQADKLTKVLEDHLPGIKQLDSDYAFIEQRTNAEKDALKEIKKSLSRHAKSANYGDSPITPGARIVGRPGIGEMLGDVLRPNRGARAAAVADATMTPGNTQGSLERIAKLQAAMGNSNNVAAKLLRGSLLGNTPQAQGLLAP